MNVHSPVHRFAERAAAQKVAFIKQIQMALKYQKPLVIHCRDAEEDCLQIMKQVFSDLCDDSHRAMPRNQRFSGQPHWIKEET